MRGRAFLALVLALALLGGCGWMDGSYVSMTPHQVGLGQTGEGAVHAVRNYTELRGVLIGMIDSGTEEALFSLAEYPREEVPEDLQRAVDYVQGIYPVGAYAVETIDYNFGTGLGASALSVDITYRRSREQIEGIRTVRWTSGAKKEVEDALNQLDDTLVLQVSGYQETDFSAMILDYAQRNPDRVMEVPGVSVRTFPDQGETRVVELSFHSPALPLTYSAAEENTGCTCSRMARSSSRSLLCQGVGDSRAFAQVYAAMCSRIGLEARVVSGKRDGELFWWNMVCIDGSWYHLDLLAGGRFAPLTDEKMTGYEWDRTAYPAATAPAE